ncbi:uncharacterized protein C8Q71DRAFT_420299 [Rhodofomes roseus]|uniref:C3H1-type domain-containing protein n=1 Tax=Rhodofomes roseus TaxID=34475 RepID=A0ABQ8KRG4_9APHY|nr:uncharacterized protein C8Q71DRAFT_420299 [Rhodofomes roseus]KAH9840700.1 hypothetical protein C8Q71DRAFT_420299 [Rhodofomes roseus]
MWHSTAACSRVIARPPKPAKFASSHRVAPDVDSCAPSVTSAICLSAGLLASPCLRGLSSKHNRQLRRIGGMYRAIMSGRNKLRRCWRELHSRYTHSRLHASRRDQAATRLLARPAYFTSGLAALHLMSVHVVPSLLTHTVIRPGLLRGRVYKYGGCHMARRCPRWHPDAPAKYPSKHSRREARDARPNANVPSPHLSLPCPVSRPHTPPPSPPSTESSRQPRDLR